ncbi:MAG: DEAD/DEAH box helicase [Chitinophagaceae bacterium]|nr:MAG: DEAD/DEAH box helicase [Chitinophagaceae bacterium]
MLTFKELGLKPEILQSLEEMGFERPTPIQEKVIPQLIESNNDLIALAQTGTGKTAAFSLPVLQKIDQDNNQVQCIILSPTRELCLQISKDIKAFTANMPFLSTLAVYGGADISKQITGLKKGAHIVVGTPGRTMDLINRGKLNLNTVRFLILDEADEMLSMGFRDDLDAILAQTPAEKQTMLFSATMPTAIRSLSKKYMHKTIEISAGKENSGAESVEHFYYMVNDRDRYSTLKRIADINPSIYAIVFCRTRRETQEIADKLMGDGYNADSLHGDLSQPQRDLIMQRFRNKRLQILVATDVAARGLDVTELTHVINYNLPDESEVYIHRSGRTGRAGKKGISLAIISKRDVYKLKQVEGKLKRKFKHLQVPTGKEVCERQLYNIANKLKDMQVNESQIQPYMQNVYELLGEMSKEDIIKKLVSYEFNKFLDYYKNAGDLNVNDDNRKERKRPRVQDKFRKGGGRKSFSRQRRG